MDNNTLHTEPRAARLFLLACLSPRPGERCRYAACFDRENSLQFSIKSLLLLMSAAALLLSLYAAFGPRIAGPAFAIGIPVGLIVAGVSTRGTKESIAFWKCMVVYVLLFLWGINTHTGPSSEPEIVCTAVVIAVGIVLSFSSMVYGRWTTKIMAAIAFLPLVLLATTAIYYSASQNWSNIVRYWFGR